MSFFLPTKRSEEKDIEKNEKKMETTSRCDPSLVYYWDWKD